MFLHYAFKYLSAFELFSCYFYVITENTFFYIVELCVGYRNCHQTIFRFFQAEVTLLFFHIKCLFMIQPKSCTMIFIDPEYVIKRYGRYYHFLRLIYFSTSFKLIMGNDSSFFFLFTTLFNNFFFFIKKALSPE